MTASNAQGAGPARTAPPHWWEVWFIDRQEIPEWIPLKPGFGHVFMLGYSPAALTWTLLDWRGSKCDAYGLLDEQAEAVRYYARILDGTCVVVREGDEYGLGFDIPVLYCVAMVKRVLGLKSWRIWTPYQLFRALQSMPNAYVLEG